MQRALGMDSIGASAGVAPRRRVVARLLHLLIVCALALAVVAPHAPGCGPGEAAEAALVVASTSAAHAGGDVADLHMAAQHCDGHRLVAADAFATPVALSAQAVSYAAFDDASRPLTDIDPLRKPPRA